MLDFQHFPKIDWEAYKKAFSRFSRCQCISTCKLSNKLLNTYSQNIYYGTSAMCPCCQTPTQSIEHMLSCLSDSTKEFRVSQLDELKQKIIKIGTPEDMAASTIHEIEHWETSLNDPSHRQRAPTYGSVHPSGILITQAYTEQTREIGWSCFLCGRISKGTAYTQHKLIETKKVTSTTSWSSALIKLVLEYSFALWGFGMMF